MAKMPDVVAPCGCRLTSNPRAESIDLIECEPYRDLCTCIAGDGAAECPYVDECLEEWRRQQNPRRSRS